MVPEDEKVNEQPKNQPKTQDKAKTAQAPAEFDRTAVVEGAAEMIVEAQEKGYFGESPDPTPRHNYTVAGVTAGEPTPETDEALEDEIFLEQRHRAKPR